MPKHIIPAVPVLPLAREHETDPEVLRRIRRLEHCCDKIERVLGVLHDLESDLHNRARNIEKRLILMEAAIDRLVAAAVAANLT